MKEIKKPNAQERQAYTSPSMRVVDVKLTHTILNGSEPTDMDPYKPVF